MGIYRLLLIPFLLFNLLTLGAANPEQSRILIHTLNYLGGDYVNAVKDGKVISEDEYAEMLEFCESTERYFAEISTTWPKADSADLQAQITLLIGSVKAKAEPDSVSVIAGAIKSRVLKISGLKTVPVSYPNLANGQKLYTTECARCHGNTGLGDGPEGAGLTPAPRNFYEHERMAEISPAHAFNTIRLGIEGTGMTAHPTLEDNEVWDLAFYVVSLRHRETGSSNHADAPAIALEEIANQSDRILAEKHGLTPAQVAALRISQPKVGNYNFIKTAQTRLQDALTAYRSNNSAEALKMATLAYLEGIEPVEMTIKASDPALATQLEKQMMAIRKMIKEKHPIAEVEDSVSATFQLLTKAQGILEKTQYSFWMALLMSISILLREGLEALLVVLIILSVIKATNIPGAAKAVHIGWLSALVAGVLLWLAAGKLVSISSADVELLEGAISLLAVAMLLYIGFWLHSKSEIGKWKEYVTGKLKNASGNGSLWGLGWLSFFVVFREVFESVLFMSALHIESGGKLGSAIGLGILIAVAAVGLLAVVVLRFSAKLPIPTLFKVSSWVMGLLAVVLAGKGIHSFQELGYVSITALPVAFPRIELLGFYPTIQTTAAQLGVLALLAATKLLKK